MRNVTRVSTRPAVFLGIACLLVAQACGSHRSSEEMLQANAEILRRAGVTTGSVAPSDTPEAAPAPPEGGSGSVTDGSAGGGSAGTDSGAPAGLGPGPVGGPSGVAGSGAAGTPRANAGPASAQPGRQPVVTTTRPGPGTTLATDSGGPKSEIVLGSVGTDSGPVATALSPIRDAARAWAADVNARGGLNGHQVRLVLIDDGGDPGRALANVKRAVEVHKVQAFYATRGFLTEQAYMSYLEEKQIPIVGTCLCNPVDGPSPMTFDVAINATPGGAWMHVGPLVSLTQKRKIAIFYCREAPICQIVRNDLKAREKTFGLQIVYEGQNSIAQPDYTAEIVAARNSGAEAVVSVNDGPTSIRILRSMRRQGWDVPYSAQPSHYDDRFLRDGGADVEGMLVASAITPYSVSPKMSDYVQAMNRWAPGGTKADLGAMAFMAGKLLEKMSPGFPATVTTKDILEALYALKGETLDGRIAPATYPLGKPHNMVNQCIVPMVIQGGKFIAPKGEGFICAPGWQPG